MKRSIFFTVSLAIVLCFVSGVSAQTKARVRFVRGASSSTVSGTVHGYGYIDYVVGASEGQTLDVRLDKNTKCVFTIFKPDQENLEMGTEQDEFTGELPVSGDYVIRVMMMRSDARRRGSVSNYRLTISIH